MTAPATVRLPGHEDGRPSEQRAGRLAAEWRAGRMVWRREMIHFFRDRTRVVVSLLQPLVFLYILGVGLSRLVAEGSSDNYLLFLFPGVLAMAAQALAISVGASIVCDRQSGFLREMLVAPVRRSTLLIGKCVGGATVATCQGAVVLASAGLIGVPYRPDLFAALLAELLLAALAMTLMGAVVAVSIRRLQTFNTVLTVLITPMTFLSGLMFPVSALPAWMAALTLLNPLTYAVDIMRRTVLAFQPSHSSQPRFDSFSWAGWHVPSAIAVAVVAAFCATTLIVAVHRLSLTDRRVSVRFLTSCGTPNYRSEQTEIELAVRLFACSSGMSPTSTTRISAKSLKQGRP
ncbi:ABC transporter permease [Streptomyces sp. NPDC001250]|uniref:ABC transporter permease n=1 Tax=unclassified Streptomyces TaxID=2593676 RepID=UPI003330AF10